MTQTVFRVIVVFALGSLMASNFISMKSLESINRNITAIRVNQLDR